MVGFDGTVYAGSDDGILHAINSTDGTGKWSFTAEGYVAVCVYVYVGVCARVCARVCVRVRPQGSVWW